MYYMDRRHAVPFMSCMDPGPKQLFQHIPAEANVPIPVSPDNMHAGHMMHSAHVSGTKIICCFLEQREREKEVFVHVCRLNATLPLCPPEGHQDKPPFGTNAEQLDQGESPIRHKSDPDFPCWVSPIFRMTPWTRTHTH